MADLSKKGPPSTAKGKGKSKPKTEPLPLDDDRMEEVDPRDPRAVGGVCKGSHCPKTRSSQFAQWTVCLAYVPRMGCHAQHRQARLLAPDTKEMIKNAPEDTESYPTNREISLQAAENSTLRQLERVRRLRDGVATTSTKAPATTEKIKNTAEEVDQKKMKAKTKAAAVSVDDDSELEEQSSLSPNTFLVPGGSEELPAHPGRKASRPSETIPEQLEYQNRS